MSAPSALRNRAAITEVLLHHAPASGRALEIASGTGEHVVALAAAMPGLDWHPTDIDADRRRSVDAWVAAEGLSNVAPARHLNAAQPGWAADEPRADLIVLVNLLHLIPDVAATTILDEIPKALAPQGIAVIYGPFLRNGEATSEGDRAFDASLRAQDPEIGYKDAGWVLVQMRTGGLTLLDEREMPANNLAFVFRKG